MSSDSPDEIELLRNQIARHTHIPDADWQLLEPYITERIVKKGKFLVQEGEKAKDVGIITEGQMRHFYTRDGEEKTTYFYFENAFVSAYISCITGNASQVTIEALTDTKLLVFPYSRLKELFAVSIYWERFGRLIAEWAMMGLEDRMVGLLTQSPEERYVALLNSNKTKILERIPQHLVANYLGITAVSLSRIRNRTLKNQKR
jgi:CRP-like cAMP-binding protein